MPEDHSQYMYVLNVFPLDFFCFLARLNLIGYIYKIIFDFCFSVDMLFGVFCECAELNPDPIESEGLILLLQIGNQMLSLCYAYIVLAI